MLVLAGGCQVATEVTLSEPTAGSGVVTVGVRLDAAALSEVGGLDALRSQLAVSDLIAAGWSVAGPAATAGGGAAVVVSHGFRREADAARLLAEVAGPGRFRLRLVSHRTFWNTDHRLTGGVDLTCGLDCFGDSGLAAATGRVLGVDPSSEQARAAQDFLFSLSARLPGGLQRSNGAPERGGGRRWTPVLGRAIAVSAETETLNTAHVVEVAVGGGLVLLLVIGAGAWWLIRARRRGRASGEVVTPPS